MSLVGTWVRLGCGHDVQFMWNGTVILDTIHRPGQPDMYRCPLHGWTRAAVDV